MARTNVTIGKPRVSPLTRTTSLRWIVGLRWWSAERGGVGFTVPRIATLRTASTSEPNPDQAPGRAGRTRKRRLVRELRRAREDQDMSQDALGEAIGRDQMYVSR